MTIRKCHGCGECVLAPWTWLRVQSGTLFQIQTDIKCLSETGGEFNCPVMQLQLPGLAANVVRSL